MALLPRKIFLELITTALLALIGVSLVMTLAMAMVETNRRGLDPISVLALLPYMIPTLLPFTIPVCLLYSCVVVYGGMSSANEIIAVKAAGIHVMAVVRPAIALGLVGLGVAAFITDRVVPNCNLRLREAMLDDLQNAVMTYLKNNNGRLAGDSSSYEIAVESIKDNRLINPIIVRKNAQGETIANTKAEEAILRVVKNPVPGEPPQITITLMGAVARLVGEKRQGLFRANEETLPLPIPANVWKLTEAKLDTLSYAGCWQRSQELAGKSRAAAAERSWRGAVALLNGRPVDAAPTWQAEPKPQWRESEQLARRSREALIEMYIRGNNSLAALAFVLLGCPVSILLTRRDALQTFFVCFAPIILLFYPSMLLTLNVFKMGVDRGHFWILGQALMLVPSLGMLLAGSLAMRRLVRT